MTSSNSDDDINNVLRRATLEYQELNAKNEELLLRFGLSIEKLSANAMKAISEEVKCQQVCEITHMDKNNFILWYAQRLDSESKINMEILELKKQLSNIENLTDFQKKKNARLERELQKPENISNKQDVITELAVINAKIKKISYTTQHFKGYFELEQNLAADDLVDDLEKLKLDIAKQKKENNNLKLMASFKM